MIYQRPRHEDVWGWGADYST